MCQLENEIISITINKKTKIQLHHPINKTLKQSAIKKIKSKLEV